MSSTASRHIRVSLRWITWAALALAIPPAAFAGAAGTPAVPVPECRDELTGDEVPCIATGAVRLWPESLRPGLPGQQLPAERDSTDWEGLTIPGAASGHELFKSVDVLGDHLFVAYNAGLQVWDVSGNNAEDPLLRAAADGWRGDFLGFPAFGKLPQLTNDVSAIESAGRGSDVLIAVSAGAPVGVSIWRFTPPSTLAPLYQDEGDHSRQVRTAELGGTVYALAGGPGGVSVYDMSAAAGLASPCLDDAGTVCPGIYRGQVGTSTSGDDLDLVERGGNLYLANSDNSASGGGPGLEIWELADPASPGSAVLKFSGLDTDTRGPALFEYQGGFYLAVVESVVMLEIRIFDVAACLDADGCATLAAPVASITPQLTGGSARNLTFSTSNDTPFLYYGVSTLVLDGTRVELLLDLTDLGAGTLTEATAGGGTYLDPTSSHAVDYWGDYYVGNTHGLSNLQPLVGKFNGHYFYRAAFGILDVHVRGTIFADGFESGDTTAWSTQVPRAVTAASAPRRAAMSATDSASDRPPPAR